MSPVPPYRFTFRAMAAEHELQLCAGAAADARRAADAAIADVARIEAKYSRYRDDSVTTRDQPRRRRRAGADRRRDRSAAALRRPLPSR